MLFINKTEKNIKVRVLEKASQMLYGWRTIKPCKQIELPEQYGKTMGLNPVHVEELTEQPEKKVEDPKEVTEEEKEEQPGEPTEQPEKKKNRRGRRKSAAYQGSA